MSAKKGSADQVWTLRWRKLGVEGEKTFGIEEEFRDFRDSLLDDGWEPDATEASALKERGVKVRRGDSDFLQMVLPAGHAFQAGCRMGYRSWERVEAA